MSHPEEGPRSQFRSYSSEDFVPTGETRVGTSEYGDIVRITGRRGSETEVVYTIKDTTTEIRGFEYVNDDRMRGFEVLLVDSPVPEADLSHIRRGQAIFEALERDCVAQRMQVLTTTCQLRLARAVCRPPYNFQPSSFDDARAMRQLLRGSKDPRRNVSLYKMLPRR